MPAFERILEVFAEILEQDPLCEVVTTRHGYTLLYWEPRRKEYVRATLCRTPKALLDALLKNYAEFAEDKLTGMDRELTAEEGARIRKDCERLRMQCKDR